MISFDFPRLSIYRVLPGANVAQKCSACRVLLCAYTALECSSGRDLPCANQKEHKAVMLYYWDTNR